MAPSSVEFVRSVRYDGGKIPEGVHNVIVGSFEVVDCNIGDSWNAGLVSGDGDTDNRKFEVISTQELVLTTPADYSIQLTYKIRVRLTDSSDLFLEESFIISTLGNLVMASVYPQLEINISIDRFGKSYRMFLSYKGDQSVIFYEMVNNLLVEFP